MQHGWYKEDLAYIHDVGFSDFVLGSAPGILEILRSNGIREGLVVDLGCGSGQWARELVQVHYDVVGIDISEAVINIARRRVPEAEFRVASLFEDDIPPCNAVTAISEVLNYLFNPENELIRLFRRVYDALAPEGIFVFDVAEPGYHTTGNHDQGVHRRGGLGSARREGGGSRYADAPDLHLPQGRRALQKIR